MPLQNCGFGLFFYGIYVSLPMMIGNKNLFYPTKERDMTSQKLENNHLWLGGDQEICKDIQWFSHPNLLRLGVMAMAF